MENENDNLKIITFKIYDLCIRETQGGDEYVAFKNAFDEDFIASLRSIGVKKIIKREEIDDTEDEE